jgi:RimJ/RimL family protein N-acetyltransferase
MGEFRMISFSDVTLQTTRLSLRPLAPADAEAVFAMRSDPVVQPYGSHPPWTDRRMAVDYIERDVQSMAAGTHAQFAIVRREDATVVGTCTLFELDAINRRAQVGYVLLVPQWGQGYANEAVTALLDWGFGPLGLNRVEADIDPRNAPSLRAMQRLGFTREGHLRERWIVGGETCDSLMYGLLAREWRERKVGP